jgi:uncharacterized protein (UPF0333 family)
MKNSQIAIGAILIALIAGGAYLLNKGGTPALEAAATTEAPAAAAPEGVAPAAPECTQYSLKAGEWVCTSGN